MEEKNNLLVNGYRFGSIKDAQIAEEEIKKAKYFEQHTVGRSGRSRLAIYDQILDKKVFQTPLGWEYLRNMQEELQGLGIPEEEIRPIPMYVTFVHNAEEENEKAAVRQRIRPSRKKDRINKFKVSLFINILLGFMVIAMFAITLQSDNPNILNYKKALVNQYATWEQELTEREKIVREKEKNLQIEIGEDIDGTIKNIDG